MRSWVGSWTVGSRSYGLCRVPAESLVIGVEHQWFCSPSFLSQPPARTPGPPQNEGSHHILLSLLNLLTTVKIK